MPFFLEKETNRIQFYEFLYKKDLKNAYCKLWIVFTVSKHL